MMDGQTIWMVVNGVSLLVAIVSGVVIGQHQRRWSRRSSDQLPSRPLGGLDRLLLYAGLSGVFIGAASTMLSHQKDGPALPIPVFALPILAAGLLMVAIFCSRAPGGPRQN
jgi:hypothetical protein